MTIVITWPKGKTSRYKPYK